MRTRESDGSRAPLLMMCLVVVLGALRCAQAPSQWYVYVPTMLFLPAVAVASGFISRRRQGCTTSTELSDAIVIAGLILAAALSLACLRFWHVLDAEWGHRGSGIVLATVLVFIGNRLPRKPLSTGCSGARSQHLTRFAGWTMVLGGIFAGTAWAALPEPALRGSVLIIYLTVVLLIAARSVDRSRRMERG